MGFGLRRPKAANPGRSLAGTVEAVGKDVTELKVGDDVYGTCDASFAEYVRAKPGTAGVQARKPVLRAGGSRPRFGPRRAAGRS